MLSLRALGVEAQRPIDQVRDKPRPSGRLARRKADEATRTAISKADELKAARARLASLEGLVAELTPADVRELAQQAEKRRTENRLEAEKQRRVDRLAELATKAAGAVLTFAQHALAAIKAKAGQWKLVEWQAVEGAAMWEAVGENGQSKRGSASSTVGALSRDPVRMSA